ncbi:hypothetical protein [Nonomuraea sp. NPDC049129]|uniref:hypothetical protein n=1 Tax=Nonomuraea sp. NPDC049129 TaxID=3155272 RepID=UPI0033CB2A30
MSEITPEKVAAAVCEGVGGWMDCLEAALTVTAERNVLSLDVTRWDGPGDSEVVRHFRAVVVPGETVPIVLERPAELGISWDDGGDLLALTPDGIRLYLRGMDEWELDPSDARELSAQLAEMADAHEAAQAEQSGGAS